jgi:hypothetical protein
MGKHEKVDKKDKVGKAGSVPSATKNEKARKGKGRQSSLPKEGKQDSGSERRGGGLH